MAWKRKCLSCGRKIDKKFNFCPWCGFSFKKHREEEKFGMIGRDDSMNLNDDFKQSTKLPFGLNGMMNSLVKQLEKEMSELGKQMPQEGAPRGFKIQISTGQPKIQKIEQGEPKVSVRKIVIPKEEMERRKKLPRVEAKSTVRRLSDRIVYEISVPGVDSGKDIAITKLENSVEIKAYSKDKCYVKSIPLKVEIIGYYIKDNTLFLELKS